MQNSVRRRREFSLKVYSVKTERRSGAMATEQEIREALAKVIDPEIGMNVVDMGMVREILIEEGQVEVRMVLTAPGCPLAVYLVEQVRQAAEGLEGVEKATVTLLDEPWRPEWMARP